MVKHWCLRPLGHLLFRPSRTYWNGFGLFCSAVLEPPVSKNEADVKSYVSCLRCVNNERTLMSMSQKLEPRRTWDARACTYRPGDPSSSPSGPVLNGRRTCAPVDCTRQHCTRTRGRVTRNHRAVERIARFVVFSTNYFSSSFSIPTFFGVFILHTG